MIDTEVRGSVPAVRAAATWLRETLRSGVEGAGDSTARARRTAESEWDGHAGNAYAAFARTLLEHTDDHEKRIGRAADALDDYAAHLRGVKDEMARVRGAARAGGLEVDGQVIAEPPAVPPLAGLLPGSSAADRDAWEEDKALHDAGVDKVEPYNRLSEDVGREYQRHSDWIEATLGPARDDAEEDGGVGALTVELSSQWGPLLRGAGFEIGELLLTRRAQDVVNQAAAHRREARKIAEAARSRRAGARRDRARTPEATERRDAHHRDARQLGDQAKWLRRGAKLLGPFGLAVDGYFAWQHTGRGVAHRRGAQHPRRGRGHGGCAGPRCRRGHHRTRVGDGRPGRRRRDRGRGRRQVRLGRPAGRVHRRRRRRGVGRRGRGR